MGQTACHPKFWRCASAENDRNACLLGAETSETTYREEHLHGHSDECWKLHGLVAVRNSWGCSPDGKGEGHTFADTPRILKVTNQEKNTPSQLWQGEGKAILKYTQIFLQNKGLLSTGKAFSRALSTYRERNWLNRLHHKQGKLICPTVKELLK